MQDQLARDFLEQMLVEKMVAGLPSFEVGPGRGDARRSRKGLSPTDVQRLIEANPDFADDIRQMYLPGPSLPGVRKAEFGISDLIG
jgi:phospholipid N-methyltransferase